jgi:hypothetical protein
MSPAALLFFDIMYTQISVAASSVDGIRVVVKSF